MTKKSLYLGTSTLVAAGLGLYLLTQDIVSNTDITFSVDSDSEKLALKSHLTDIWYANPSACRGMLDTYNVVEFNVGLNVNPSAYNSIPLAEERVELASISDAPKQIHSLLSDCPGISTAAVPIKLTDTRKERTLYYFQDADVLITSHDEDLIVLQRKETILGLPVDIDARPKKEELPAVIQSAIQQW